MNRQRTLDLDPGIRSEAFHRVMVDLAVDLDADVGAETVSVSAAVRLAELTATYLAVSVALDGERRLAFSPEALELTRDIWRTHGWSIEPDDPIIGVVETLVERAVSAP